MDEDRPGNIITILSTLGVQIHRESRMRTKTITLSFALCLPILFACVDSQSNTRSGYSGPKDKLHIYLLIGQSNMAGRAPFSEEEGKPLGRCFLLDGQGAWDVASNPLNRHSTIRKDISKQQMNPGYSFAQTMLAAKQDVSLGLVVNARGGSRIELWAKDSTYYREALHRVQEARKTGTLKGILWHQGEANVGDPSHYIDKLTRLVSQFREDLDMPELPFVAGQIHEVPAINDQIAMLPERLPFTGFVSSRDLTIWEEGHFDTPSVILMGQRYAEVILKIQTAETPG